jgi:hypothetical protein
MTSRLFYDTVATAQRPKRASLNHYLLLAPVRRQISPAGGLAIGNSVSNAMGSPRGSYPCDPEGNGHGVQDKFLVTCRYFSLSQLQ